MAVYTEVSKEALLHYLADFDIPPLKSFTGIEAGIENTNYFLDTTGERFVLTLFEKRTSGGDLPYYTHLMTHVAAKGLPCPRPQKTSAGDAHKPLLGKPALIVSCLPGQAIAAPNAMQCEKAGQMLARLHLAAADFDPHRPSAMSLPAWHTMAEATRARSDEIKPGFGDIITDELAYLDASWPDDIPTGTVHGDFFPDNVLWQGGDITGVIDFYFACTDALAYDLALTLNAWCFDGEGTINQTAAEALLAGYTSVRPLTQPEIAALSVYLRAAALRILLTRTYDQFFGSTDALVVPKDPIEYLNILTFHQQKRELAYYGLK